MADKNTDPIPKEEIRKDPLSQRWVILAPDRARRPQDIEKIEEINRFAPACPFCEGNEKATPPEIWARRSAGTPPDSPGWTVRVVPNRYPALTSSAPKFRTQSGLFKKIQGAGAHEVIIESPDHNQDLAKANLSQIRDVLTAYRDRILSLYQDAALRYVQIFKNHKFPAGASLQHPHSQLIATPILPQYTEIKLHSAQSYYEQHDSCLFCEMLHQENTFQDRVILRHNGYISYAPFASRFPFEVTIAPLRHTWDFAEIQETEMKNLAYVLKDVLLRLKQAVADPPYNYFLSTAPNLRAAASLSGQGDSLRSALHWHLEILPRQTAVAGFEWGSGFYINTRAPEEAARILREAQGLR